MENHECVMMDKIDKIGKDVLAIKQALLGNEYNEEGVIKKLIRLEQTQTHNASIIEELMRLRKVDSDQLDTARSKINVLELAERKISKKIWLIYGGATVVLFLVQLFLNYFLNHVL